MQSFLKKQPLTVFFFLFIVLLTVLDLLTPDRLESEAENKRLAQAPVFSFDALVEGSFGSAYEDYINDQFVGKDAWIDLKSRSELLLGKLENNGVIYGRDGQLFAAYPAFDETRLSRNVAYLREFLQLYPEIPATVMIVPSSYSVLRDILPQGTGNVEQGEIIRQIYASLGAVAHPVDLLPILYAHAEEYIYYRTDHHWTALGAYYAYLDYAAQKKIPTFDLDTLSYTDVGDFYGTLYYKSKRAGTAPDAIRLYDIPVQEVIVAGERKSGLHNLAQLEKTDKYAALLHSNNGLTVIASGNSLNPAPERPTRALVVKDSFTNTLAPYLTYCYDELYIVDARYFGTRIKLSEVMAQQEFDEILIVYGFENLASDSDIPKLRY